MLDRNTFGKTPAAIYLADRLNIIDNSVYTRKMSKQIHAFQGIISDAIKAQESGKIEMKTFNWIMEKVRQDVKLKASNFFNDESVNESVHDKLSCNLFENILIGELKSVNRRVREVALLRTKQNRLIGTMSQIPEIFDVMKFEKITIANAKDYFNVDSLIEKSRAKLDRKNKPNTFYK